MALAARLAAFAKARVEHEAKREKAALEEQIHQMQASSDLLQKEKGETETQLAVARTKVECSKSDMSDLQKRCDELVAALVENEKERRSLEEALVVAKKDAIDAAHKAGCELTDEASAMEFVGARPILVMGSVANIKITHPTDLAIAEALLGRKEQTS